MENKLQQLTKKLYEEGLSKGRSEAESLVEQARSQARDIIKKAEAEAVSIVKNAKQSAEELRKNTNTEIVLASRQTLSVLKQQIEKLIVTGNITPAVGKAMGDKSLVREAILAVARGWNDAGGLKVVLPESTSAAMVKELEKDMASALGQGFEITLDNGQKTGFRVGPRDGGYYISFSEADFDALFKSYLRPKAAEMLFGKE